MSATNSARGAYTRSGSVAFTTAPPYPLCTHHASLTLNSYLEGTPRGFARTPVAWFGAWPGTLSKSGVLPHHVSHITFRCMMARMTSIGPAWWIGVRILPLAAALVLAGAACRAASPTVRE